VTGPGWVAAGFAALMLVIAASCAARLAIWRPRGRDTETDADGLHLLMGVAMAGMLEPRLSPLPGIVWQVVFTAAAAWFTWQAICTRSRGRPGGWRCAHPAPHAVECAAMLYMLVPARQAGYAPAVAMPGMSGPAAGSNPAIALVLALFMLGYVLWTTDRLATLWRARTASAGHRHARPRQAPDTPEPASSSTLLPWPSTAERGGAAAAAALAPRFAACYKIAMSVAMGYMLMMML
jgi:hypothetical protein